MKSMQIKTIKCEKCNEVLVEAASMDGGEYRLKEESKIEKDARGAYPEFCV